MKVMNDDTTINQFGYSGQDERNKAMLKQNCEHRNTYTDRDRFGNEFEWCPDCEQQTEGETA